MFLQDYPVSERRTTSSRHFYSLLALAKLGLSNSGSIVMEWDSLIYWNFPHSLTNALFVVVVIVVFF